MPKRGDYDANASADSKRQRRYNSQPAQKKRRAQRNAARAEMERAGKVRKGDGKDVDHVKHSAKGMLNNSKGNLRVLDKSKNRAKNLGTGGRKKGR
jgi:hypothetical protein